MRLFVLLCAIGLGLAVAQPAAAQEATQGIDTINRDEEIIYIDASGYIKVLDPQTPSPLPPVTFRSPDAGWYDAVVGDVNGDGDAEIVAISDAGYGDLLKVYDPVVNDANANPDNQIGGVYWEALAEIVLPGRPLLVEIGNLDANQATQEIVVVHQEANNPARTRIQVFYQPIPTEGGRLWRPLTDVSARELWSDMAVADLDGDGQAEIALVNEDEGTLGVFRRDTATNVLAEFWSEDSKARPWSDVAIGNVDAGLTTQELVAVRNAMQPQASVVVRRYKAFNQLEDVAQSSPLPAPRVVFLADLTGNGDEEILLLRDVPTGDARPRLFTSSNLGTDAALTFEAPLSSDNGFRYGAGGDINGDGRDEIAVIRDDAILLFPSPNLSNTLAVTYTVTTNRRTITLGNLDLLGRDLLGAAPATLRFSVPAGEISAARTVTLTNATRSTAIPFGVTTRPATGLLLMTLAATTAPTTLQVRVDARTLLPAALADVAAANALPVLPAAGVFTPTYGTNLLLVAASPLVMNSPITIPVIVDVTAGVALRPSGITLGLQPEAGTTGCVLPAALAPIQALGTPGSTFTTTLTAPGGVGGAWLSVTPASGATPADLTISLAPNPGLAPGEAATAELVLTGSVNTTTPFAFERRLAIDIRCFSHKLYLPLVGR